MQPQLLQDLSAFCRAAGFEPIALQEVGSDVDLTTPVLQQSILLREAGAADLSLALLDRATAAGLTSGWLQDNRARALVQLQRHEEAKRLWSDLKCSEDLGLRTVAEQNLQSLALEAGMDDFHIQVQALANELSWDLQRIRPELNHASEFEFALLEEAVLARERGAPATTLALMEWAIASGFPSPWLEDNRARALVVMDRVVEACDIWRALVETASLEEARTAAAQMLKTFQLDEQKQRGQLMEQALLEQGQALASSEGHQAAIAHLAHGLLLFPDSSQIESDLVDLLRQLRTQQDQHWMELTPWMQDQELLVEVFEQVLLASEDQSSSG